jgi:hypothetical protein
MRPVPALVLSRPQAVSIVFKKILPGNVIPGRDLATGALKLKQETWSLRPIASGIRQFQQWVTSLRRGARVHGGSEE